MTTSTFQDIIPDNYKWFDHRYIPDGKTLAKDYCHCECRCGFSCKRHDSKNNK